MVVFRYAKAPLPISPALAGATNCRSRHSGPSFPPPCIVTMRRWLMSWKVPYGSVPPAIGPDSEAEPLCAPPVPISTSVRQAVWAKCDFRQHSRADCRYSFCALAAMGVSVGATVEPPLFSA